MVPVLKKRNAPGGGTFAARVRKMSLGHDGEEAFGRGFTGSAIGRRPRDDREHTHQVGVGVVQIGDLGHHFVFREERHGEAEVDGRDAVSRERGAGGVDHPLIAAVGVPIRVRTAEVVVPRVHADVLVGRPDTQTGVTDRGWPRRVGRSDEDIEFGHGVGDAKIVGVREEVGQDDAVERHSFTGHDPLGDEAGGFDDRRAGVGLLSGVGVDHASVVHVLGRVGLGAVLEVGFGGVAGLLFGDRTTADGENEDDEQIGTHGGTPVCWDSGRKCPSIGTTL